MAKLMSVPEVAEILRVKEPTIRKWIHEKRIEYIKIGSFVRFDPAYVEKIQLEGLK